MKLGVQHATVKKNQMIRARAYPINFPRQSARSALHPVGCVAFLPRMFAESRSRRAENCGRAFL
jgi:hypothetical protein